MNALAPSRARRCPASAQAAARDHQSAARHLCVVALFATGRVNTIQGHCRDPRRTPRADAPVVHSRRTGPRHGPCQRQPAARPSIFNDDEEFALLTTQDELMLKMLYDPRLQPGMDAAQAAPIAPIIAPN